MNADFFNHSYSNVADIATIVICIMLWLVLGTSYSEKTKNLKRFYLSSIFLVGACLCRMIVHCMVEYFRPEYRIIIYFLRFAYFLLVGVILVFYNLYIMDLVVSNKRMQKAVRIISWTAYVLFEIANNVLTFFEKGFYLDPEGQAHADYHYDLFHYFYVFMIIFVTISIFRCQRRLVTKVRRGLLIITGLAVLMVIVESILQTSLFICFSFAMPLVTVVFLFHYSAYDEDTGSLNYRSYLSYMEDKKGKPFHMVNLYLKEMNPARVSSLVEHFYHFNEQFFKNYCIFRMDDNRLTLVCPQSCNPNFENVMTRVIESFEELYEQYRIDYKILYLSSDPRITTAKEYYQLNDYVESIMSINTARHASNKDIEAYLRASYIYEQILDINKKMDLDDERVKVYCQPVMNTMTGEFSTAEVLMRLELDRYGMVYPDQFIPIAENYDLIHTMSMIILNKTCKSIYELMEQGKDIERISVNFSVLELRDKHFCDDVISIIEKNQIPFEKIAIELTETKNEKDFQYMTKVMNELHEYGIKFYLDDFGTGYSNIERIIGLPIDIIKFDRSLTILAGKDETSRYMVGSFSDIFVQAEYHILFEGVEDEKDEKICREMNAEYLQGYKYSRPIPIEELTSFLQ